MDEIYSIIFVKTKNNLKFPTIYIDLVFIVQTMQISETINKSEVFVIKNELEIIYGFRYFKR